MRGEIFLLLSLHAMMKQQRKRAGMGRKEIELELERGACLLDRPTFLCLTGLVRLTGPGQC